MSEQQPSGFGQFIPGFDFLQNLAKSASQPLPTLPGLANWVAPTLSVEELDRRIGELKAVRFWLEQNASAVGATVQALEVQKMTLATLRGMNFDLGDIAEALKAKPQAQQETARGKAAARTGAGADEGGDAKVIDPLQWWTALTQQFQQIAAGALQEVAASAAGTAPAGGGEAGTPQTGKAKGGARTRAKRPARPTAAG